MKLKFCCKELKDWFKALGISTDRQTWYSLKFTCHGSLSITSDEIYIDDGWNNIPNLKFNYCPFCGTKR